MARHILAILEQHKGETLRFSDIKRAMARRGWTHIDASILDNFKILIEQKKIVKIDRLYGIPIMREDGTAYLKIRNYDATIELGKLGKDGSQ